MERSRKTKLWSAKCDKWSCRGVWLVAKGRNSVGTGRTRRRWRGASWLEGGPPSGAAGAPGPNCGVRDRPPHYHLRDKPAINYLAYSLSSNQSTCLFNGTAGGAEPIWVSPPAVSFRAQRAEIVASPLMIRRRIVVRKLEESFRIVRRWLAFP